MKGSLPVKIGRLVANLARHPHYVPRTIKHNVINGATPLDLELPWFSYSAIDFLSKYLTSDMQVCEYGSGGSTLFFARRTREVFSIEDNPTWHELVTDRVRQLGLKNVQIRLCPFDFKNPVGFEQSEYLLAHLPNATKRVVDGAAHGMFWERPERTAEILLEWTDTH